MKLEIQDGKISLLLFQEEYMDVKVFKDAITIIRPDGKRSRISLPKNSKKESSISAPNSDETETKTIHCQKVQFDTNQFDSKLNFNLTEKNLKKNPPGKRNMNHGHKIDGDMEKKVRDDEGGTPNNNKNYEETSKNEFSILHGDKLIPELISNLATNFKERVNQNTQKRILEAQNSSKKGKNIKKEFREEEKSEERNKTQKTNQDEKKSEQKEELTKKHEEKSEGGQKKISITLRHLIKGSKTLNLTMQTTFEELKSKAQSLFQINPSHILQFALSVSGKKDMNQLVQGEDKYLLAQCNPPILDESIMFVLERGMKQGVGGPGLKILGKKGYFGY